MREWEFELLHTFDRHYTSVGIREVLPQLLSDLDVDVGGSSDEFARVLLESVPHELPLLSIAFAEYDFGDEETHEGEEEVHVSRFYLDDKLRELHLGMEDIKALEANASTVALPAVEPLGEVGDVMGEKGDSWVRAVGDRFRVTGLAGEGRPPIDSLLAMLRTFEDLGKASASVEISQFRVIEIEGEEIQEEEEKVHHLFVERLVR